MNDLRTTPEVAELLGVEPHRVIYLCEKGVVKPEVGAAGRGSVRRFNDDNLFVSALALELQRWGVESRLLQAVAGCFSGFSAVVFKRGRRSFVSNFRNWDASQTILLHLLDEKSVVLEMPPSLRILISVRSKARKLREQEWPLQASWVTVDVRKIIERLP